MGLAHPHDSGGGSINFPGVSSSGDFGDNNLPLVLKEEPKLEKALHKINDRYYYSSHVTSGLYMINLILSTVSIYMNNAGSATVTAYMSFVILILLKLYIMHLTAI